MKQPILATSRTQRDGRVTTIYPVLLLHAGDVHVRPPRIARNATVFMLAGELCRCPFGRPSPLSTPPPSHTSGTLRPCSVPVTPPLLYTEILRVRLRS